MYESTVIAEVIKKSAKLNNIQLKNMLIELELNKNTLSNMYKGSMLKADSLARIADYLDCSVDYLLGRTDNPEINKKKEGVIMDGKLHTCPKCGAVLVKKPLDGTFTLDDSTSLNGFYCPNCDKPKTTSQENDH